MRSRLLRPACWARLGEKRNRYRGGSNEVHKFKSTDDRNSGCSKYKRWLAQFCSGAASFVRQRGRRTRAPIDASSDLGTWSRELKLGRRFRCRPQDGLAKRSRANGGIEALGRQGCYGPWPDHQRGGTDRRRHLWTLGRGPSVLLGGHSTRSKIRISCSQVEPGIPSR